MVSKDFEPEGKNLCQLTWIYSEPFILCCFFQAVQCSVFPFTVSDFPLLQLHQKILPTF